MWLYQSVIASNLIKLCNLDVGQRSGAFLFVDFLRCNHRLLNNKGDMVINNTGLAALTLLVAESDPNQKETLIKLIMNMLSLEG